MESLIADLAGETLPEETETSEAAQTESGAQNEPASEDGAAMTEEQTEKEGTENGMTEGETEAATETETEPQQSGEEPADGQTETQADVLSEEELDAALEEAEQQDTYDEESGLTLGEVLEQAQEQEVDLLGMEEGEVLSFTVETSLFAARAAQNVDVKRGSAYYYADYGLGSYVTYPYTVTFGSVKATAYCVQPSKAGPGDGNYTITKLGDSKVLALSLIHI